MGRACSMNGEWGNVYRTLVGKPEGKRSLGRPRCRWVDNIKMNLRTGSIWLRIGTNGGLLYTQCRDASTIHCGNPKKILTYPTAETSFIVSHSCDTQILFITHHCQPNNYAPKTLSPNFVVSHGVNTSTHPLSDICGYLLLYPVN
jgi:hypothetical protein